MIFSHLPRPWPVSDWGRSERWEGGSRLPPVAPSGCSPWGDSSAGSSGEDPAATLERRGQIWQIYLIKNGKARLASNRTKTSLCWNSVHIRWQIKSLFPVRWIKMIPIFKEKPPVKTSNGNQMRLLGWEYSRAVKYIFFCKSILLIKSESVALRNWSMNNPAERDWAEEIQRRQEFLYTGHVMRKLAEMKYGDYDSSHLSWPLCFELCKWNMLFRSGSSVGLRRVGLILRIRTGN